MDFLFIVYGLLGLLWGALLLRRGGLIGGCLTVVVAGCCFGHPFFNAALGPIPLTSERLLLAIVVLQYIIYRRFGRTDPKPLAKVDVAVLLFTCVLTLSTFLHDWQYAKNQPLSQLLFLYAMPAVFYWVVKQAELTERALTACYAVLALLGVYLAVTAIAETHQWWSLVYPAYIASPEFPEFLGRGRGPLLNPVGNGILLGLCLASTLVCWPRLGRAGQLVLLGVIALELAGMYYTLTRSVWMGGALALLIVVGLTLPRAWRMPIVGTAVLAGVIGLATSWEHWVAFKRDKELSAAEMAESAKLRPILAVVAWNMFVDRPLFGCGFGQYPPESKSYLADRTTELPLEKVRKYVQHNTFLGLLTETGLVGLGLFVLVLVLWSRDAWHLWRTEQAPLWERQCGLLFLALMAVYLPNAMLHNVSLIPMVNMLLFFVAGLTSGLAARVAAPARAEARLHVYAAPPAHAAAL